YLVRMFTQRWGCVALFALYTGYARETGQSAQWRICFACCFAGVPTINRILAPPRGREGIDTRSASSAEGPYASCLCLGIVQCLVKAVERSNAGIDVSEFRKPLVSRFGLKDGTQNVHCLFAFAWTCRRMEG